MTSFYVASETPGFTQWMGFAPDFVNGVANNNGDDAVLLYQNGAVVDAYGVVGVDGTGQSWETLDGWGHRNSGSCPSSVYIPSQWSYSGIDALDDSNVTTGTNTTATPPYPTANFSPGLCGGSGACAFMFMDTVTIRQAPVVDAGPGRVTCGVMTVGLSATGIGVWSGGLGTFSNVNSPTSNYTPTAAEVGGSVYLYYSATDAICGSVKDSTSITFIQPPLSAQFTYQATEFCPEGENPVVSHTTGVDGIYSVTQGNAANVDLDNLSGEIDLTNTQVGNYTITNTVYACGNLIITGIIDGPLTGGQPKAIELYALADIADLSVYGIGVANNGGGSDGIEFNFPPDFVAKGTYIYATANGIDFQTYFGFPADYLAFDFQVNGDDAVELFCNGDVIDVFGEINQSGTGLAWEYMDGWVYRKNNANITGNYFNVNDWIYGGVNVLDNSTTNANATNPFPVGTFTTTANPVCPPNTFSQAILIGDNRLPTVVCPPNQTIILPPGDCGLFAQFPLPQVTDNCGGDPVINQTGGPLPGTFVHKDDSPVTVTFEVFDYYGNGPVNCSYQVFILEYPYPTTALACNNRINLSLDENCSAIVGADMVLEGGPYGCYDDYVVTIAGITGNEITTPGIYNVTVSDPQTGNSCWGVIYAEDKLPPIIRCEQPMCDLLTLSGEWDSSDNAFSPGQCWAFDGFTPNPNVLYDVLQFTVAVGGDYTFTMDDSPNYDGIAGIFAGSFDANDPCANLIGGDDDINGIFETEPSFTINLTPGTYYLVSSTWTTGQIGVYNWTFSGPAALQTPCEFTCLDKEGIINGDIEIPEPEVFECSDYTLQHSIRITGDECTQENIIIEYIVTDLLGSKARCTQTIAILPLEIDDVIFPVNPVVLSCNSGVSPEEISNYFEDVSYGYPHVYNFLGDVHPLDNSSCNVYAAYQDATIAACGIGCGGNSKVIRTWTLLNWCTLETATYVQIIKAVDTKAPTFIVKDVTVSVNPWGCVANFQAPMPWELQDNCDAHPVWWLEGPAGVVITGNSTDGYFVTGAPKGTHAFTYKAVDCCGNIGSAVAYVTVFDRSAPVAVAKQNIVISLTGSGTGGDGAAKLYTWHVDNGSYDHCTAVKLELRRPDGAPDCGNLGIDDHNNNVTFDDDDSASPQVRWAHPQDDRDDTDNGAYVKFCCDDLGSEISVVHQVIMRVWDDGNMNGVIGDNLIIDGMQDNYNETWADIRVENKIPPVLVCPLDATITCDMELNLATTWTSVDSVNLTMTGGPATAFDLCNGISVEYKDTPSWTNTCENVGRIRREFRAVKGDKTVNCYQNITVSALPSTFVVTPPSSSVLDAPCDFNEGDIKDSDKPKVQGGPCDVIGENIHIDTFLFEDGVCKKWRVTYNYINWCTSEQKGPYVKYYKYKDDVKPVLTCQDQMFAANPNPQNPNGNCEGTVNLEASATDEGGCTANGWLKWQVFVDLWGNGTTDYEFSSFLPSTDNNLGNDTNQNGINDRYVAPTASGATLKVPAFVLDAENSVHKVQWKVTDGCGNVTDCYSTFMVVDKKAPTPYCISLSSAVMQNGQVELWAIDFDKGSFDNCTPRNALMFTFNGEFPVWSRITEEHYFKGAGLSATVAEYNAGNAQRWVPSYRSSAMIFNCDDVEASPITLNMSVWDSRQNTDFCSVELTLVDNQGACGGSRMSVGGDIKTEKGLGIKNVAVKLRSNQAGMEKQRLTDVSGDYMFGDLPVMVDYHITGEKRDDWMNGVSTLDLVMIQRHILGVAPFNNGYKMVAADVNNDGKVTASDLVILRKMILGLIAELPNNDSWRFLDAASPIVDVQNPWPLDEEIVIEGVDHDMMQQHFMGVKVGDVSQDASANGIEAETRTSSRLILQAEDKEVKAGELVRMDIRADQMDNVNGMQFTLRMQGFVVEGIESGKLTVDGGNYGSPAAGEMTFSWSDENGVSAGSDEVLFTVILRSEQDGKISEMIELGSWTTRAESYSGEEFEVSKVELRIGKEDEVGSFALYQNEPNPFKQLTSIQYQLPENGEVVFELQTIDGKLVMQKSWKGQKGKNSLELSAADAPVSGVYYYTMRFQGQQISKALLKME
ncbi:MAG: T9SS type A sorting domain-containing protein [Saprospiraceae bacterium]|nr:T9SS type A sorting domain-containing protein [Saprospiraceae bacterium]